MDAWAPARAVSVIIGDVDATDEAGLGAVRYACSTSTVVTAIYVTLIYRYTER